MEPQLLHQPDEVDELDEHDRGLAYDLATLNRRQVLKLLGFGGLSAGLFTIVGCSPGASGSATGLPAASASASGAAAATAGATAAARASATAAGSTGASATATDVAVGASCAVVIPEETAGPFPGDGSNGVDVLNLSGIVRADIRKSFGTGSATAEGVPLTIVLAVQDANNGCAPLAGAAVYLWHCDQAGNYSLYSQGVTNENYLRGVQATAADGSATFTSIFPACYSGRWPHIHFEVYPTLAAATDQANKIATSQIALPKDTCDIVYATDGYSQSVANLTQVSLASDNVFGDDGGIHEIGTVTGSLSDGFVVTLAVPVATA